MREISDGLSRLPVSGAVEVHSSLSAFGRIEGGAETVVDALVEVFDTIIVPAFTYDTYAAPPDGCADIPRNGIEEGAVWAAAPAVFHADMPVSREIGAIPEALRKRPGAVRGMHPVESFAALGAGAAELLASQTPDEPLAPIERLLDSGGWILMLGTDLTSCTALHLAEARAGRNYFVRWCADAHGNRYAVRVSGCSRGFGGLDPIAAPLAREIAIGNARVRAFPARELVAAAADAIRRDGRITVCRQRCTRCIDALAGGPVFEKRSAAPICRRRDVDERKTT